MAKKKKKTRPAAPQRIQKEEFRRRVESAIDTGRLRELFDVFPSDDASGSRPFESLPAADREELLEAWSGTHYGDTILAVLNARKSLLEVQGHIDGGRPLVAAILARLDGEESRQTIEALLAGTHYAEAIKKAEEQLRYTQGGEAVSRMLKLIRANWLSEATDLALRERTEGRIDQALWLELESHPEIGPDLPRAIRRQEVHLQGIAYRAKKERAAQRREERAARRRERGVQGPPLRNEYGPRDADEPGEIDTSEYTVQVLGNHMRVSRHDGRPIVSDWDTLQAIKNEYLGEDVTAIEVYPAEHDVVCEVNYRHFWVVDGPILDMLPNLRR